MKVAIEKPLPSYKEDYYSWAIETAKAIREGRFELVDWEAVAEELEDMGKTEKRELKSRLSILLAHLLKWFYPPEMRTKSWYLTIKEQRKEIKELLYKDSPGLKRELKDLVRSAYESAVFIAAREAGLDEDALPKDCPWTIEQILDDYFPGKI